VFPDLAKKENTLMKTVDSKVRLNDLFNQVWEELSGEILQMIREGIEALLEKARDNIVQRPSHARGGSGTYRSGYRLRKVFDTRIGNLGPLRIPRVRGPQGEIPILADNDRRCEELANALAIAAIGGLPYRKTIGLAQSLFRGTISCSTVAGFISRIADKLEDRRKSAISDREFAGVVADAVYLQERGRKNKSAVLVAVGVRRDGSFMVLDWEAAKAESELAYEALFQRLSDRGFREPGIVVGDDCNALWAAADTVFPFASKQACLYHLWCELRNSCFKAGLDWPSIRRFQKEYWRIFDADSLKQASAMLSRFDAKWRPILPHAFEKIDRLKHKIFAFLAFPVRWRHRLRTTNLAEGFFRNFRRFLSRFPGVTNLAHAARIVALYLVGAETAHSPLQETPKLFFNTIP
jgi:putative transposase